MKIVISSIMLAILLSSCNELFSKRELGPDERTQIFQKKYGVDPYVSFQVSGGKLLFLRKDSEFDAVNETSAILLKKRIFMWDEIRNRVISSGYSIDSIRIVKPARQEFLYFEQDQLGGSLGNKEIDFSLYNIKDDELYFIKYEEWPKGCLRITNITQSENLTSNPVVLEFLQERLRISNRKYKPDAQDSLVILFLKANQEAIKMLEDSNYLKKHIQLKLITTNDSVIPTTTTGNLKMRIGSIACFAENENFTIISWFKGPVLGYNKSTKKYFCIWAPASLYNWVAGMNFENGNTLKLGDYLLIDLQACVYIMLE